MKKKIEELYIKAINEDLAPCVFADEIIALFEPKEKGCLHYFPVWCDTGGIHYLPCEFCGLVKPIV